MDDLVFFWEEPETQTGGEETEDEEPQEEEAEEEEWEEDEEMEGSENGEEGCDGAPASEIGMDELPSESECVGDRVGGKGPTNPNPERPVSIESTAPMPAAPMPEPASPPCVIATATSKPGGGSSPPPPVTNSGTDPLITPPPKGFQPLDLTPEAVLQVS